MKMISPVKEVACIHVQNASELETGARFLIWPRWRKIKRCVSAKLAGHNETDRGSAPVKEM